MFLTLSPDGDKAVISTALGVKEPHKRSLFATKVRYENQRDLAGKNGALRDFSRLLRTRCRKRKKKFLGGGTQI